MQTGKFLARWLLLNESGGPDVRAGLQERLPSSDSENINTNK
jgi:hypothetical protein